MTDNAFDKIFNRQDCYEYCCEARDCCECPIYQEALTEYEKEKANDFGRLKVSVAFQNHFADILYNKVEHAIYEWLGKHTIPVAIWSELIQAVNDALYAAIKACMDNNGMCIELFSEVSKSIYVKQYSRGYLKSWTKEQLIKQVECLQHNFAVATETNYQQAQYFEKCVQDEVQKRLTGIEDRFRKAVPPIGCTVGGGKYGWDRAIDCCLAILKESDKSE